MLRSEPDRDTVRALSFLARNAVSTGHGDADSLTSEALHLGQALDVDDGLLARLFSSRGVFLVVEDRLAEAVAHFEYAARIAERSDNSDDAAVALINLSDALLSIDAPEAAEAARAASEHSRRIGGRSLLAIAVSNFSNAMILSGDWNAAEDALGAAADTDGIDDVEELSAARGALAARRGDVAAAQRLAELPRLRASDDPQHSAQCAALDALIAAAEGDPAGTLAHAHEVLAIVSAIGLRSESFVEGWPLAVRAARTLGEADEVEEMIAMLDIHPVGHLPALVRAERDLARARRAGDTGEQGADELFRNAVAAQRRIGSPYHLAQALLDQAEFLAGTGEPSRAEDAVTEARALAAALGARPVVAPSRPGHPDARRRARRLLAGRRRWIPPQARPRPSGISPGEDPIAGRARVDAGPGPRFRPLWRHTSCVAITPAGGRNPTPAAGCRYWHPVGDRACWRGRIPRLDPAQSPALGPRLWYAVLRCR